MDVPSEMYEIAIANEQALLELDENLLQEVIETTLAAEQVREAQIGLAIVDDVTIWALNRQYLAHDYPTDVLSFLLEREPGGDAPLSPTGRAAGCRLEGEIVVSAEMALRTAVEYHWRPQDEVLLYIVHGLLHVCGYDDLTGQERDLMRAREQAVLRRWNLVPHYAGPGVSESGGGRPAAGTDQ